MKKQDMQPGKKRPARKSGNAGKQAPEADSLVPPEKWNDILLSRARALSQQPEQEADTGYIEVVTFLLAYETYGIETVHVREVYPLKDLTPLPCTPPFVAGIINVRGQVMSVIDIKKFFELPEQGITDLNKAVIVSDGVMEFGILADAIVDVRNVPLRDMQPALPTLTGIREDYLKGVTAERLVILDAEKLLTDGDIVVHEEVM